MALSNRRAAQRATIKASASARRPERGEHHDRGEARARGVIAANTDMQSLEASLAPSKLQLGTGVTRGLGAAPTPRSAGRPPRGPRAIAEVLRGADMVFIHRRHGRGHRHRGRADHSRVARELGALTVAWDKPFTFEGKEASPLRRGGTGRWPRRSTPHHGANDKLLAVRAETPWSIAFKKSTTSS